MKSILPNLLTGIGLLLLVPILVYLVALVRGMS
jgi:hypothetical protein